MVAGEVCCGFFHELKLHLEFPGFPLELAQPRPLIEGQRRLFPNASGFKAKRLGAGFVSDCAA
jgi:hypothetical protein